MITTASLLSLLESLLNEPLKLRHHRSGHWRVDPANDPASSPNAGLWHARGRGGWFPTADQAIVCLAFAAGSYKDAPQSDHDIEHSILALVSASPGLYTARKLRGLAKHQTGLIGCAAGRCDKAVKRLVEQGRICHGLADGRSAGRLYPQAIQTQTHYDDQVVAGPTRLEAKPEGAVDATH